MEEQQLAVKPKTHVVGFAFLALGVLARGNLGPGHRPRVWSQFGGNPCSPETPMMFLFVQQSKT